MWFTLITLWAATLSGATAPLQERPGESPASRQESPSHRTADSASSRPDDTAGLEKIEQYIRQGEYQSALPLLQAYLKRFPQSARAYYDLGYTTFRTHDLRTSITSLSKSLSLNSHDPEAHKILGLDLSFIGRYDLAEQELREAVRLKPDSAEMHYFLGRFHYTRGVYPLARKELEEALRLDPKYMKAWNNLGLTMEVLGDDNAALKCYTTAMNLNEEQQLHSEWPYINMSAFYNRQEKPGVAIEYGKKAIGFNPRSAPAHMQMARAYRMLGDWQRCAESAQEAIDLNPRESEAYYVLGLALRKLGRSRESQAAMAKFEQIHKEEQVNLPERLASPSGRRMGGHPEQTNHDEEH